MPFLKQPTKIPQSKLLDIKTQKCGFRHTVFSVNGDEYIGEWQNNQKHGEGIQFWKTAGAIYKGDWKFGKRDGHGTYSVLIPETKEYAMQYYGEWKNGNKNGYGTHFYSNSEVYEGEWSEDQRSGRGLMYYENGDYYDGEWLKDKNHGQGIYIFANENCYVGTWKDGKKNGNGKFYYLDKGQLYEGVWVDGVAKCGTLSEIGRAEAPTPTKYPIPKLQLVDMEQVLNDARSAYLHQV